MRPLPLLSGLLLLACLSLLLALLSGSLDLPAEQLWPALGGADTGLAGQVLRELRLPRAGAAFAVGGLLALAGAMMQVLLRNPLADPYILGTSGGAAAGALGAMLLGWSGTLLAGSAFAGALFSTLLVFGLARSTGNWSPGRLLLTGVVVAAGWGALIAFLLAISPERNLRGMLFWIMGDLGGAGSPLPGLGVLVLALLCALVMARPLNLLARGALQAAALGVSVEPLRLAVYGLSALVTAVAVTLAGSVGFLGLVAPHMVRLLGARDHRVLLPAAVLLGGSLLILADTLARTAFAPRQLPVGILTALLGVPLFLYLLARSRPGDGR